MKNIRSFPVLAATLLALASCDSPSGPSPAGAPAHLDVVSGDLQTATVGTQLPAPLVVKVTDDKGKAVQGQVVNFKVTAGNGTVFAGTGITDKDGLASERWTLGTVARDTQKVEARAVESSTGTTLVFGTFRAIGTPDAPAALTKVSGDAQTGPAAAQLAQPVEVRLADRFGNPVQGQTVTFAALDGGSMGPGSAVTDSAGRAHASWTLGARVDTAHAATATTGALPPVTFTATATVAGTLTRLSGDAQTGVVAHPLADSLVVRLATSTGIPIRGATIQWSAAAGTTVPATSSTDANGVARSSWLLGSAAGSQAAQAALTGSSQTVGFTATALAGPADHVVKVAGDGGRAAAGAALADSLAVRVLDSYENPVAGTSVSWTAVRGGGTLSPTSSTTGADGVARSRWTLGPRLDSTQVARASAGALPPVDFTATAGYGSTTIRATSGDGQTATVHTTLAQPLVVTVELPDGRPVPGAQVQWQIVADSGDAALPASLSAPYSTTDALGQASVQWTLGTRAGSRSVRATAQSGLSVVFTATGTAAAAERLAALDTTLRQGDAGAPLADSLAVVARDHYGNGVPGVAVAWTAVAGGGSLSPASGQTGPAGVARAQWTLGGRVDSVQVARAAAPGLTPVDFRSGARGVGLVLTRVSGDGQSAEVSSALPQPLRVSVTLPDGRPVRGATVRWRVLDDSATAQLSGALYTDSLGRASATWSLGIHTGTQRVRVAAGGDSATFTATATPGGRPEFEFLPLPSTAPVGSVVPVTARAKDAFGNLWPGLKVTFLVQQGGGTVTPDTVRSDSLGLAATQWTLGYSTVQTIQVTASPVGLAPTANITATGGMTIDFRYPDEYSTVRDTLAWGVTVGVGAAIDSVVGEVAGRTVRATVGEYPDRWFGTLLLAGVPEGPITLKATVFAAGRPPASVTRALRHDGPPVVAVQSPASLQLVQGGSVHIAATCTDDLPAGCTWLRAKVLNGAPAYGTPVTDSVQVASGTASIDANVPLPAFEGQIVTLRVVGSDSTGQVRWVDRVIVVNSSPHLGIVSQVAGTLFDADASRLLFRDTASAVQVRDRSGGGDTQVASSSFGTRSAYLFPGGVVLAAGSTNAYAYEWRGAGAPTQVSTSFLNGSQSLVVRGSWALWSQGVNLVRRDLAGAANTVVSTNAGNQYNDVAADGTVAWWDRSYGVHRDRAGVDTVLAAGSASVWNTWPVTDGGTVVFRRTPPCCSDAPTSIVAFDPSAGEVVLTTNAPGSVVYLEDYQVAGGWIAYVQLDASGQAQVWRRSPAGAVDQVSSFSTASTVEAVGADGTVVFRNGRHRFLAVPGAAPVDLGPWVATDRVVTISGRLVILQNGYALQVNP